MKSQIKLINFKLLNTCKCSAMELDLLVFYLPAFECCKFKACDYMHIALVQASQQKKILLANSYDVSAFLILSFRWNF